MIIKSERLILRDLRITDANDMFEYTSIPEVSSFLLWSPHKSIKEDEDYILKCLQEQNESSFYLGTELKSERKLIGCNHVYHIDRKHMRAEISFVLSPYYQLKGYATEAVRTIIDYLFSQGFVRIQSLCDCENNSSEEMLKRCGTNYEGTLINYAILKDGKAHSMKMYAICNDLNN